MLSKLFCYLTILRWLYSLNLTIDANFRLKNKARTGGIENDPPLGDGLLRVDITSRKGVPIGIGTTR